MSASRFEDALQILTDPNPSNDGGAVGNLTEFIQQVEAKRGKKIDDPVAAMLIRRAEALIAVL